MLIVLNLQFKTILVGFGGLLSTVQTEKYPFLQKIYSDKQFFIYRSMKSEQSVAVKTVVPGPFADTAAKQLRREFDLLSELKIDGVVKALAFEDADDVPLLVMEDVGSKNMAEMIDGRPVSITEFLNLAIQMTEEIAALHRHNVIHLDINPRNFVMGKRPTLIDFGLATTVPGFAASAGVQGALNGTLPYMAPEQTGRTNHLVDSRADLYALGSTFYELLTGVPPFQSQDPLEVVHALLARIPVAPNVVNSSVPEQLSSIVLKLLAKMPQDRYQSAEALAADLGEARRQFQETGTIQVFDLGRYDIAYGIFLSGKLYGREREQTELESVFKRVAHGANEVVFISGKAGVGKSSLVQQAREQAGQNCVFLSGKCDALRGNIPYGPFVEAMRVFVRDLIASESEEKIQVWRQRIQNAIAPNGQALVLAVPDFERLLGAQPPLVEVGPVEAENRFRTAFKALIKSIASTDQPCVLFLDDLHWADSDTLSLLRVLSSDPDLGHLLTIGAYRTDEVGGDHPLIRTVASIQESDASLHQVELHPLSFDSLVAMLCDALNVDHGPAGALAKQVLSKTEGNPFFVRQFLNYLQQVGLLVFDVAQSTWKWDLDRISAAKVTDNVLDLLVRSLRSLPESTQGVLAVGACIGSTFDLKTLSLVLGDSVEQIGKSLWSALRENLLVAEAAALYRFSHDRVQQAAYQLLSEDQRAELHVKVGRALRSSGSEAERAERLYSIVSQLNRGVAFLSQAEKDELIELNRRAGKKARDSAAYFPALHYLKQGLALLPPEPWKQHYALWFEMTRDASESAYLTGDTDLAEKIVKEGLEHAESVLDRVHLHTIAVIAHSVRGTYSEALKWGRDALRMLNFDLPETDYDRVIEEGRALVNVNLAGRAPADLLQAPMMTNERDRAVFELLANLVATAWYADQKFFLATLVTALNFTLQHGNHVYSASIYSAYGLVLVSSQETERSREFSKLAMDLAERFGNPVVQTRVMMVCGGLTFPWSLSLRTCLPMLRRSIELGIQCGEFQFASYSIGHVVWHLWMLGAGLDQVLGEINSGTSFFKKIGNQGGTYDFISPRLAARCLKGQTRTPGGFDDDEHSEAELLAEVTRSGPANVAYYHVVRLQTAYLLRDFPRALESAAVVEPLLSALGVFFVHLGHAFYSALSAAALSRIDDVRAQLVRMKQLEQFNLETVQHQTILVEAELARIEGGHVEAPELYKHAIAMASKNGFPQDEALAHELFGRYLWSRDQRDVAETHLERAVSGYSRWGARAKVEALQKEFSLQDILKRISVSLSSGESALDYMSLLRAAETLGGELEMKRLLEKLLGLVIEAAGAEKGILVLEEEGALMLRAMGSVGGDVWIGRQSLSSGAVQAPSSVFEHIRATGEEVLLTDAARDGTFVSDPYIATYKVRSILGVPIKKSGKVVAVLCLENSLYEGAFSANRATFLRLLSGHLGVALDNARLYEEAQEAIRVREEFLSLASHELRTPLTSLKMQTQLLKKVLMQGDLATYPRDKLQRLVETSDQQIIRFSSLVSDLLDVTRISAGKLRFSPERVDLSKVVRENAERFGLELRRAGCRVELVLDESIEGRWDVMRIDQVIANLIVNAMKYGPGKPIEIATKKEGDLALLLVKDHGIGIAKKDQSRIFDRFERASSSRTYGGLGLGLYIVREILTAHQGSIRVESELGKGSTFIVELPLVSS